MGLNVFSFTGHLVKDSETKTVGAKNSTVMNFTVANNTGFGEYAKVSYIDCQMWGERTLKLSSYLLKGTGVYVTGQMEQQRWTDKEGKPQSRWACTVQDIGFIGGGKSKDTSSNNMDTFTGEIPF